MRRREFVMLAASGVAILPLAALAQTNKPRRIAFVHSGIPADRLTETGGTFWIKRFYEELRRLGAIEGVNLVVERYSAGGSSSRFASLAAEVVSSKPDVIICNNNVLVKAFMAATAAIPIVAIMGDPLADGLVSNLARPGGNLTGVSIVAGPGIAAKRLQLLKEAIPESTRFMFLLQSQAEQERSGLTLPVKLFAEVNEAQFRSAFAELAEQHVEAVLISDGGSFLANRAVIIELAAKYRLPLIYPYRDYAEQGGLMAYGPDLGELAARMAGDVHQIFNGTKPGDIPVYQPSKFELVINLKTANTLGLTIPPLLLAQADEVIE